MPSRSSTDAAADDSLGRLVRSAHRAFARALEGELAGSGVGGGEWSCLRVLWDGDGLTGSELARALGVEKASLTPVLAGLARKRLVRRVPDPEDRRKLRLHLTEAGSALRSRLLPAAVRVNAKAARHLTPEDVHILRRALSAMVVNFAAPMRDTGSLS